jgi:uridine kinase
VNPQPTSDLAKQAMNSAAKLGATVLITIDGPAGSGKTTLSHWLGAQLKDVVVVSCDDLYGGWADALGSSFVDRVTEQLITPLLANTPAKYIRFNWFSNEWGPTREIGTPKFLILEGVGSGNSAWREYASLRIWVETPERNRAKRVIARDGDQVKEYLTQWQADEAKYFQDQKVESAADIKITN